jgi:Biotin/lipoate A/B protein ligase family
MTQRPVFPPLLRPLAATPELDPFERCRKLAIEGAEAGTLLWSIGQEKCECAIALAPERPLDPPGLPQESRLAGVGGAVDAEQGVGWRRRLLAVGFQVVADVVDVGVLP